MVLMSSQCNPDIREILSGPKSEPVLPKQNRPKPDIRDLYPVPITLLYPGYTVCLSIRQLHQVCLSWASYCQQILNCQDSVKSENLFKNTANKHCFRLFSMIFFALTFFFFFFFAISSFLWLVWFHCLMAYQPSWFIKCQNYSHRRITVVLFNP